MCEFLLQLEPYIDLYIFQELNFLIFLAKSNMYSFQFYGNKGFKHTQKGTMVSTYVFTVTNNGYKNYITG